MKFTVYYSSIQWYSADVEANSFDEAREIADEMDGGDFVEDPCSGDWELEMITDENGNTIEY